MRAVMRMAVAPFGIAVPYIIPFWGELGNQLENSGKTCVAMADMV